MARVHVVEDDPSLTSCLESALVAHPALVWGGCSETGEAALRYFARETADVVLMDIGLPGIDGLETTRRLCRLHRHLSVLVMTVFADSDLMMQAVRCGAAGYVVKGSPLSELFESVLAVAGGGAVLEPSLARALLRRFRPESAPNARVTPREAEVLQLVAKGCTNREVARILRVSRATVRTHLENLRIKLEATNRVELVGEALRLGILSEAG
ncbi:MAG: response regulator [Myxococcota bacterium]